MVMIIYEQGEPIRCCLDVIYTPYNVINKFSMDPQKWACDYLKVTVRGKSDMVFKKEALSSNLALINLFFFNRFGYK